MSFAIASATDISVLLRRTRPFLSAVRTIWSGGTASGGTIWVSGGSNSGTRMYICFSASGVSTMKMMSITSTTSMSGVTLMSVIGVLEPSAIDMATSLPSRRTRP